MKNVILLFILICLVLISCEERKSEFSEFKNQKDSLEYILPIDGQFEFSGYKWKVIEQKEPQSMFDAMSLSHFQNVYLDNQGRLYLKISKIGDTWYGADVVCDDNLGKGDYIFHLETDCMQIPSYSVLSMGAKLFSNRRHSGLTEAGVRLYGYTPSENNKMNYIEYYTYTTEQKFASIEIPEVRAKSSIEPTLHVVSLQSRAISFATREGFYYDQSRYLAEFSAYKGKDIDMDNIDRITFANIGVPLRPFIKYYIDDTIADTTINEAIVIISKFEFFKPIKVASN